MNRIFTAVSLLVLPLTVLLFAQWPLREWVQAGSREANDLAQIVFAAYSAVAITAASRHGVHLAANSVPGSSLHARWRLWALRLCVVPWALFMLAASGREIWASLAQWERFPETGNPGYFVIKLAVWLLLALALVDALWPARRETS